MGIRDAETGFSGPARLPAAVSLLAAMVSWALAPVFIRYLSDAYDPYSQAFIRYGSATVALVALSWFRYRSELLYLLGKSRALLGVSCLNVVQQCMWTAGTYESTATMAQLITKLNVVFVIIFSFFLFREERAVIRSPLYLGGTLLSLVGVTAVLAKNPASAMPVFDRAAALLLATAVCWGVYMVWAKHLVMGMHPIPMFTVVSIYTTLGLGAVSLVLGEPGTLVAAGGRVTAIAFISGLFPIALAHPAFHFAQRNLGSAFSNSCNLLTPLLTYLFGIMVLVDEYLTWSQWLGAAALIGGTALVTFAGQRAHRRAALTVAAPPD